MGEWIVNTWKNSPDWIKVIASASGLISVFQLMLFVINKLRTKLVGKESKLKRLQDKVGAVISRPFKACRVTILYGVTYWSKVKVKPKYDYVIKYYYFGGYRFAILNEYLEVKLDSPGYQTRTEAEIVAHSYLNHPKVIDEKKESSISYQYVKMRRKDKEHIEDVFEYNKALDATGSEDSV